MTTYPKQGDTYLEDDEFRKIVKDVGLLVISEEGSDLQLVAVFDTNTGLLITEPVESDVDEVDLVALLEYEELEALLCVLMGRRYLQELLDGLYAIDVQKEK